MKVVKKAMEYLLIGFSGTFVLMPYVEGKRPQAHAILSDMAKIRDDAGRIGADWRGSATEVRRQVAKTKA